MEIQLPKTRAELARYFDATILKADTKPDYIMKLCKEARENKYFGVCVNPCYVSVAKALLDGSDVKLVTVIGYPLGANTLTVKSVEAARAFDEGADELDMVINIGQFKMGNYDYVCCEIDKITEFAKPKPVKVIIETCYLDDVEIAVASVLARDAGAAYVKTSTGMGSRGASVKDVEIIRRTVGPEMGIKAAGGIRTTEQVLEFIHAGATRIGTSTPAEILKGMKE
jgi:deoxyribose-phosphate aldolase